MRVRIRTNLWVSLEDVEEWDERTTIGQVVRDAKRSADAVQSQVRARLHEAGLRHLHFDTPTVEDVTIFRPERER